MIVEQNIGEIKTQMDGKLENLNKKMTTQEKTYWQNGECS